MKIRIIDLMDYYSDNAIKPTFSISKAAAKEASFQTPQKLHRLQKPLLITAALLLIVAAGCFALSLGFLWNADGKNAFQSEPAPVEDPLGLSRLPESIPQQGGNSVDSSLEANSETTMDEETFFSLFWELDRVSMNTYLEAHPEILDHGWANLNINESGLDEDGTEIQTIYGDQVLAVNAKEGIVLIRVYLSSNRTRGVMAICKDTSRLSLCPAETLGTIGQTAGTICDANHGILAITGSAFLDVDGTGLGGELSGLAICDGISYGTPLGETAKRLELRTDNKMYIVDSESPISNNTRDACEFQPAVIVDGEYVENGWDSPNPRAVLGQTSRLETIMVVAEGRLIDSLGCGLKDIGEKMLQYGCVQALNLDGGTCAIMCYDGKYITRCSNTDLPEGRTLPTAWVYHTSQNIS